VDRRVGTITTRPPPVMGGGRGPGLAGGAWGGGGGRRLGFAEGLDLALRAFEAAAGFVGLVGRGGSRVRRANSLVPSTAAALSILRRAEKILLE